MEEPAKDRRAYHRQYAKEHQAERTVYMRSYRQRVIPYLREQILERLGGRCANCGITDIRVLTIDHRFGGGSQHRRRNRSTLQYYQQILGDLDSFRLLCWNCNWLAHRHDISL